MPVTLRLILLLPLLGFARGGESPWQPLFNGTDLDGWRKTIAGLAPGADPDSLVQVRDGKIHMYADTAPGTKVPFGVITHEKELSNYHLRFEYMWLEKRFPPRAGQLRDAGLIYHVKDARRIWPSGVECQVQEGDTGDLVLLQTGGFTWMRPEPTSAPDGQGKPGTLPENGGIPASHKGGYIGRFEEADQLEGWNQVEVIVHGSEGAQHVVNGRTLLRVFNLTDPSGKSLSSGKICLQLEGAELVYRNVEVRELPAPLLPDRRTVSLSAVKDQIAHTRFLRIANPGGESVFTPARLVGKDADAFDIIDPPATLPAGGEARWTIAFRPLRGGGRYSAGLQVGDPETGTFVVLQGIGLEAFEGRHEAPLQDIVHAFGIPLDVGGGKLELDSNKPTIGESVDARYFRAAGPGMVRITPLARYSPRGDTPVGVFTEGAADLRELGRLADSSGGFPDAHQALLPPLKDGASAIEFDPGGEPFGFYMAGHRYLSFTDPERPSKAGIKRTARVFPVKSFQGKTMKDTWLIGFEEASNGDYQDAVLMVENITPR